MSVLCPACGGDGVVTNDTAAAFYELERAVERAREALADIPTRVSHALYVDELPQYRADLDYIGKIASAAHAALSASASSERGIPCHRCGVSIREGELRYTYSPLTAGPPEWQTLCPACNGLMQGTTIRIEEESP
jgi:hypothetical protein